MGERPVERVAILGAGHGGCAAAADLGRRGVEVRIWGRSEDRLAPLRARGGVEYVGALGEGFTPLARITTGIGEAVDGADLVAVMVPTHAHEAVASLVATHLEPDQVLLAAPGHTLLLIPATLARHGAHVATCETGTLPYICRMEGATRVRITRPARSLPFAAFPARETDRLAALVRPILPAIAPVPNVLATLFAYTNAIHHPPAALCNAGRIEATGGDYCHYYDGITPAVGRVIDVLDGERRAVGRALDVPVVPLPEHFFALSYTTEAARASGRAYEVFHQSEPDRWIRAPASLAHRFLDEDVPYGLVPLAELGRLGGVPTPTIDALIHLASVAVGRDYHADGLTLERMGLAGITRPRLAGLLEHGFEA